jgi:outer membrane protein assembly factor BamB
VGQAIQFGVRDARRTRRQSPISRSRGRCRPARLGLGRRGNQGEHTGRDPERGRAGVLGCATTGGASGGPWAGPDAHGAPTAQYDAANSGFHPSTAGPTDGATERWLFSSKKSPSPGRFASTPLSLSPAVAGGTVYAGGVDGSLYAVDAVDGAELWRFRSRGSPSATAAAGTVCAGGSDLYALDPADGAQRWRFETEGGVSGPPRVVDGTVYVSAGDPFEWRVRAVDAHDGTGQWYIDKGSGTIRPPAVVDSTVYVSADGVHALGAADGTELWYRDTVTQPVAPAVANGAVYVGEASQDGENGFVTALDRAGGTEQWRRQVPGPVRASVAVTDSTVYAGGGTGTEGYVIAVDAADGTNQWIHRLDGLANTPPVVADGTVYVADNRRHVVALDAATGRERWQYGAADEFLGSPVVVNDTLYLVGREHVVHALADPGTE